MPAGFVSPTGFVLPRPRLRPSRRSGPPPERAAIEIIQLSGLALPKLLATCDIASHPFLRDHAAPQQQGTPR